jgi:hypothetical protein
MAEYFWEPVPSCWTIRRAGSGTYQADHSDSRGIPPFTTIAWRLWHLVECYGGIRNPQWLGVERQPAGFERDDPAPATAAEAIAALERAHAFWQGLLHQLDEQIHHGAELGVLRDLYRHSRTPQRTAGPAH